MDLPSDRPVVLIDPGETVTLADEGRRLPMALVHLASHLAANGFSVRPVLDRVVQQLDAWSGPDPLFVGLTGHSLPAELRTLADLGRRLKRRWPAVPVVVGGWHATVFPESLRDEPFVDLVVRGAGEAFVLGLAQHLGAGGTLDEFAWPGLKREGSHRVTPVMPCPRDESAFPPVRFDLFDRHLARTVRGQRAHWLASRGCDAVCRFCAAGQCSRRTVIYKPVGQLLSEMRLLHDRYGVREFHFSDSCLFSNVAWAGELARGLISGGLSGRVRWRATTRVRDYLAMDGAFIDLLKASGLTSFVIGFESGSDGLLVRMRKQCTVREIHACLKRLAADGLGRPLLFFITEFPGEQRDDLRATIRLIGLAKRILPDCDVCITPFIPVSPAFRSVYDGVTSLSGFSRVMEERVLWSPDTSYRMRVRDRTDFYAIAARTGSAPPTSLRHRARRLARRLALARLENARLSLPLEWWAYRLMRRLRPVRAASPVAQATAESVEPAV